MTSVCSGMKSSAAREVLAKLECKVRNANSDTVPKEVWDRVRHCLTSKE